MWFLSSSILLASHLTSPVPLQCHFFSPDGTYGHASAIPSCKELYNAELTLLAQQTCIISTTCQKSPQQLPPGCKHCHHPLGSVPPTTTARLVPHPHSTAPTCWLSKCLWPLAPCQSSKVSIQGEILALENQGQTWGRESLIPSKQSPKFKVSFGIFAHWETWQGSTKRSTATERAKDSLVSMWSTWSHRTLELLAAWWPMTTSASQQARDVSAFRLQCFHSFRFTRSATGVFSYLITFSMVLQTHKVLIEAQNCTFATKRGLFIYFYFLSS